jgi:hypothetical protein
MFTTKSAVALLLAGAATVLAPSGTAFAAPAPAGHTACRISVLPDPAGTSASRVFAGDPTGRYLIGDAFRTSDNAQLPVVWTAGRPAILATPGSLGALTDVNSAGVAVGYYYDASDLRHGFIDRHGRLTDLPPLVPGDHVLPLAVNRRGDVLGTSQTPFGDSHPVIWPAGRPDKVYPLPTVPGALSTTVSDIDDDGTVVGTVSTADRSDGYVWPWHGQPYALPLPAGVAGTNATAIRHGWIGGYRYQAGVLPVRWSPGAHRPQLITDAAYVTTGINASGTMAAEKVIVHRDGRIVTLPSLPGTEWLSAYTIADTGVAAGEVLGSGTTHAVVWRGC